VVFAEEQIAADAENIVATMGLRPEWANVAAISLAHSYGFSNLALPLLLYGIPMALAASPLPEATRQAARAFDAVVLPGVPALWRAWLDVDAIPDNVKLAISAGAPLGLDLERRLYERRGLKLRNFYGASECGGIAFDRLDIPRDDAALAGTTLENVEASGDADGCLVVSSRAVATGYWPEPSSNLGGGVFRTGDLAEARDGRIFLRGRAAAQIHIAGRKIAAEAVEEALRGHPGVRAVVVFGVEAADAERVETMVACVAAEEGVSEEALRRYMLERVPAWQIPREWWMTPALAPNERGKLSRHEWRRKYLDWRGR
jgi:acyl-CoA synthetase (AMP-forming)/AMP-acid ligase II